MRTIAMNCLPGSVKKNLNFFFTTFCLGFALFFNTNLFGQTTPASCVQGCTSNDVQIQAAYLSNQAGVKLGSGFVCPQSGVASVYLTLELTTNTPRVGVAIYTNVKVLDANGNPTGNPIASPNECFGIALNQPTNKVTFQTPFNWSCGTAIALTDVFIAWGTGNKNFCTGTGFQCPATPSKCYQLPGDKFIAIETPSSQNQTVRQCSDAKGGTTSTFNLNNVTVTNSSGVTITWWENYTSPSTFTNQINSPGSYSSGSKTVYAKITSNSDATVFSVSTVTLVVNQTPSLSVTNPNAVCSPATVDITAASVTAGSTLPAGTTLTYYQDNNGAPGNSITSSAAQSLGNGTYWIRATTNTTPACSDQKAVVVTVKTTPDAPVISKVDNCNGTTTITAKDAQGNTLSATGLTWSNGTTNTNPISVSATTAITCTRTVNGCTSGNSNPVTPAPGTTQPAPTIIITNPTLCSATGSITVCSPIIGATYTLKRQGQNDVTAIPTQQSPTVVFSNLAAGSNPRVTVTVNGCESTEATCADAVQSCPQQQNQNVRQISTQPNVVLNQEVMVNAYPNPFNDRVKFVVNAPTAGNGRLDIYNVMGQKIKTVYQGHINAGNNSFELTISKKQQQTLVYIFSVGNKKVTGKLLQLDN